MSFLFCCFVVFFSRKFFSTSTSKKKKTHLFIFFSFYTPNKKTTTARPHLRRPDRRQRPAPGRQRPAHRHPGRARRRQRAAPGSARRARRHRHRARRHALWSPGGKSSFLSFFLLFWREISPGRLFSGRGGVAREPKEEESKKKKKKTHAWILQKNRSPTLKYQRGTRTTATCVVQNPGRVGSNKPPPERDFRLWSEPREMSGAPSALGEQTIYFFLFPTFFLLFSNVQSERHV